MEKIFVDENTIVNPGEEKILIVDDEQGIIDAFREIFARTDYQLQYANNGKNTIKVIQAEKPNIVILDTTLPDIDALELLDKIKTIDSEIRVIMMSWHTSANTITKAFQKKASEFILKPFQSSDVLKKVRKSLLFQRMSKTRIKSKNLMPLE